MERLNDLFKLLGRAENGTQIFEGLLLCSNHKRNPLLLGMLVQSIVLKLCLYEVAQMLLGVALDLLNDH